MSFADHVTKPEVKLVYEEIMGAQVNYGKGVWENVVCSGRTGDSQPERRALLLLYRCNEDKTLWSLWS